MSNNTLDVTQVVIGHVTVTRVCDHDVWCIVATVDFIPGVSMGPMEAVSISADQEYGHHSNLGQSTFPRP